jgi:Txe/YoeB family toxin of Txe-Axe toxin-antitoxin module
MSPSPTKAIIGDLKGYYSRRINIKHRLVYAIDEDTANRVTHLICYKKYRQKERNIV